MPARFNGLELAREEVSLNRDSPRPIQEFARIRLEDAEVGAHNCLRKHALTSNVPIEKAVLAEHGEMKAFPWIKLSSWAKHMLETGRFCRQLAGAAGVVEMQSLLGEFWARYEKINPEHDVFQAARCNDLYLPRTVPFYSHTDEGRSLKHEPLNVLSCHGALGRGTQLWVDKGKDKQPLEESEMGLNFLGQAFSYQFLIFTMLRKTSTTYDEAQDTLIDLFAKDAMVRASLMMVSTSGWSIWGPRGTSPRWGSLEDSTAHSVMCPEPHLRKEHVKASASFAMGARSRM